MTIPRSNDTVRRGRAAKDASGGKGLASWRRLALAHPRVVDAYVALREACKAAGPLDERTAALVKLAVSVGARAERTTYAHTRKALAASVSPEEIRHVALLSLPTIGLSGMREALGRIGLTLDEAAPAGSAGERTPARRRRRETGRAVRKG